jgi:hypothetical protein
MTTPPTSEHAPFKPLQAIAVHTPGPWHYDGMSPNVYAERNGQHIAIVEWQPCKDLPTIREETTQAAANGRLIAAAPELLKICQLAYATVHAMPKSLLLTWGPGDLGPTLPDRLRAAIASLTAGE